MLKTRYSQGELRGAHRRRRRGPPAGDRGAAEPARAHLGARRLVVLPATLSWPLPLRNRVERRTHRAQLAGPIAYFPHLDVI